MFIGAALTLGLAELWLRTWLASGYAFPVGRRVSVLLPAGSTLVYYESLVAVPRDGDSGATLRVEDADQEPVKVSLVRAFRDHDEEPTPLLDLYPIDSAALAGTSSADDLAYHLWPSGWSGRALWQVDAPAAGRYTLLCHNHSVFSDADLPADDRIALLRDPASFSRVRLLRTIILITGGTVTITAVIVFYALHVLALDKRRTAANHAQASR